ncbi:MAG TPA: pseudouridine-5'-phosphate glycosidase [Phycisphaerales bacterium]|nr:pseudouridine-5'-phosphate glycosidase [Phycisphaerales bacterium]
MARSPAPRNTDRTVALETTLLLHGVPARAAAGLARDLAADVRAGGGEPAIVGVVAGEPVVGLSAAQLSTLLRAARSREGVPKTNTSNLGVAFARGSHAATTVSTTMELAADAGVRVFATGGIGGVHRDYARSLDMSADLAAFTRFPVAVVTSGVKSILDVEGTREVLETLGVPVVGFRCDRFPAFYRRESGAKVDARFEDVRSLAAFASRELARTGRGIVVANPIPRGDEVPARVFEEWLRAAAERARDAAGRDATPAVLSGLHEVSEGATLRANIALVRSNARLAGRIAAAMPPRGTGGLSGS